MVKSKVLDMDDLKRPDFVKVNNLFNAHFGNNWPEVPLRRWEYVAAIVFSGVMDNPGTCLDAGSGTNVFARFLNNIGCDVVCTDIGIGDGINNGITRCNMSMTDMKFKDNTLDYVFAMSSIEHVNAGKFKLDGFDFDEGDGVAFAELCRVLEPGGKLILTTDFADKYYPPPGMWPTGSHRIYSVETVYSRLIKGNPIQFDGQQDFSFDWSTVKEIEPKGYGYTEAILTLEKPLC